MDAPRIFCVDGQGVTVALSIHAFLGRMGADMGVSPSASAAYDLLTDDGVPPEKAAELAVAMQRVGERRGSDPEAMARHFVKLRHALKEN